MTNSYDVLSRLHAVASAKAEKSVAKELEIEDPPVVEGKALLEAKIPTEVKAKFKQSLNEDTKGNDGE